MRRLLLVCALACTLFASVGCATHTHTVGQGSQAITGVLTALGRGQLPTVKVELGNNTLIAMGFVGLAVFGLAAAIAQGTVVSLRRRR